jgi:hypothetical protein
VDAIPERYSGAYGTNLSEYLVPGSVVRFEGFQVLA